MATHTLTKSDLAEPTQLNLDYVNAVQRNDVNRFDQILAPEFYCSNPDGTLIDRAQFLQQTALPISLPGLAPEEGKTRIVADFAITHARPRYVTRDAEPRHGRYTDCWA